MTDQPDLEQVKQEEFEQRKSNAMACAHALSGLMIGERLTIGPEEDVLGVPGGFIFYRQHKAGITGTFVPVPNPTPQQPAPKIDLSQAGIELPRG